MFISRFKLRKEIKIIEGIITDSGDELVILAIYGNYNDQWKLNILQAMGYSYFKMTSVDYYKLTKECYQKSYLVDAVLNIDIAKGLSSK